MTSYTFKANDTEDATRIALEEYNTTVITTFDYKQNKNVLLSELADKLGVSPSENEGLLTLKEKAPIVSRRNPFNLENNITEGACSKKLVYEILDLDGKIYASEESKKDALKIGRDLIKQLKKDLICKKVYRVDPEHEVAFKLTYTPQDVKNTYLLIKY